MVGQGSVNHNSRKFNAKNTDPERSHLNITYCHENIKTVFHELFDEALKRYNDKQTRADRKIEDYYEKIRSSKQEKPFHEIILQVGNKDDMSAESEDGQLAAAVLDEYMRGFQERNPQLRVFSAHLHMDEATPHLHIDFVPFTTGSKRGLDTRVSLKQALSIKYSLRLYEEPPDRERGGSMNADGKKPIEGNFHAVSCSGGKDSTAMLLLMIERDMPIDVVLTADTGMEFPEMYEHMQKLDDLLYRERGIHITTLRHPRGFEWLMFEEPKVKQSSIENRQRLGVPLYGNGWPGVRVRWCTSQLKTHLINKEVNRLKKERNALHYVGIAADEPKRIKDEQYPLVDWGVTEAEALRISYDRGFDWGGLYRIYNRCSCWCCPLQRIGELKELRSHHPELWARLREMDRRAIAQFGHNPLGQFMKNWTVEQLERRFAKEDRQISVPARGER